MIGGGQRRERRGETLLVYVQKIRGLHFQFICHIRLERDQDGNILQEQPASRYHNLSNLPLNAYGNGPFCRFRITRVGQSSRTLDMLGVYAILDENNDIMYIGKCTGFTSALRRRFNAGYGRIQPRNCYKRGQSTNCRVNNLVLQTIKKGKALTLFFHETQDGKEAKHLEARLVRLGDKPPWNINKPW